MTPSEKWLEERPGATLIDYVQAMQGATPAEKRERFLDATAPDLPRGYFKWLKTGDNGDVFMLWALLAAVPVFGLLCAAWDLFWRGR